MTLRIPLSGPPAGSGTCVFCGAVRPSEGGGVHIPDLPPHVLKALRLLEELADAKRISTVEWEAIVGGVTKRASGHPRGSGFVFPAWSLDDNVSAPTILSEG